MLKVVNFIDLCCGMGGFREGLEHWMQVGRSNEQIALKCVFSCDVKDASRRYQAVRFPDAHECGGDLRQHQFEVHASDTIHLLFAGFPCQPFSNVGRKLGFADQRNIFEEIVSAILAVKPQAWILENVKGLLWHGGRNGKEKGKYGPSMERILSILSERLDAFYQWNWKVISATECGVSQARSRVFFIGVLKTLPAKDLRERFDRFFTTREDSPSMRGGSALPFSSVVENVGSRYSGADDCLAQLATPASAAFARQLENWATAKEGNLLLKDRLIGKTLRDLRGGSANLSSWELGLRGEINEMETRVMHHLVKERRKREHAKNLDIAWADGMPLPLWLIEKTWQGDDAEKTLLAKSLEHLTQMGYLVETPVRDLDPLTGKRVAKRQGLVGYDIPTRQLSFPIYRIIDCRLPLPTITATDGDHYWLLDEWSFPPKSFLRPITTREFTLAFGFGEECMRAFEDAHLSRHEILDLLGNSVPPPLITAILSGLLMPLLISSDTTSQN